jgi:hypothetical protein
MTRVRHIVLIGIVVLLGLVGIILLLDGRYPAGIITWFLTLAALAVDIVKVKCKNCGAHPVLGLFAFWGLLLDPALFISDALFLRHCSKCKKDPFKNS